MSRTIPEETIAEIKSRSDLASIIGRTVKLKRVGRNLVGLCPFHTEKSPSFNVSPDEGFYYCFGCKAAGDVVTFLEKTSGRGFLDIITELAAQTGVELPKVDLDPAEEERLKERKRILRVLELTQVFFRTRLTSDEGRAARTYLSDVRKIDDAAIDSFGLGFAGARDDGLALFLKEQGVASDDGIAAGVLGRSRDPSRGPFDFFRHRVTVPIRGQRGEVLSFQGRIFGERELAPDGSKRPKYINGPQSLVYDKSNALFGIFESLPALKKGTPAVLVEGPLDAIAVHRAGVQSAIAPCGSSLTPRHVDDIKRRTDRVIVCMDADKAGRDASEKAILMMLQVGLDVGLVALPDKDPDQMVHAGRADELRGLILGAPSALDAAIARARGRATGNVSARVAALDELLPYLAAPQRDLVRAEAARAAARAFNEDPDVIAREVSGRGRRMLAEKLRQVGSRAPQPNRALPPGSQGSSGSATTSSAHANAASPSNGAPMDAPEYAGAELGAPARAASLQGPSSQGPSSQGSSSQGSSSQGSSSQGSSSQGSSSQGSSSPQGPSALGGQGGAPVPAAFRPKRPSKPLSDPEVMLVEALLTHPHLAARCGVLMGALRNDELKGFIERLIEMLVRFHDEDPRAVLTRVPMRQAGQIRGVVHKVAQAAGLNEMKPGAALFARPDAYLSEAAAARIIEDAMLRLDRRVLELRLGELQELLAAADERGDHDERKRVLTEQALLVDALQALGNPAARAANVAPPVRLGAALASNSTGAAAFLLLAHAQGGDVLPDGAVAAANAGANAGAGGAGAGGGANGGVLPRDPGSDDAPPLGDAPARPAEAPVADDLPWAGDPDDDPWAV